MAAIQSKKRKKKKKSKKGIFFLLLILIVSFIVGSHFYQNKTDTAVVVRKYFDCLNKQEYEEMYNLVQTDLNKEEFVNRVKTIYETIEASDINIEVTANSKNGKDSSDTDVTYTNSMQTIAGKTTFINTAKLVQNGEDYLIKWNSSMIFPELDDDENIKTKTIAPTRGAILDRNGISLAKSGGIYTVGLVKGKMDDTTDLSRVSQLLGISESSIKSSLNASYVRDDTFVPIRKISREEQSIKNELLQIKGILINDSEARVYPYKEAASILTGYIKDGKGQAGLEYSYNEELTGKEGIEVYIEKNDKNVKTIIKKDVENGMDLKLTIDIELQQSIYEQFKNSEAAVCSINYNTGEILALVSTPSYDANQFVTGITNEEWDAIQNNSKKPMFNRYLGAYAPGSSLKPITGTIGLMTNSFTASEDFGKSGTKWQNSDQWKNMYVTTLETYDEPANLENALVYSDNIYFAKAALKIGKDNFQEWLKKLGFGEKIEFKQDISASSFGEMSSELSIANSGYGQAEMLVNPVHMASIYSMFANNGSMVKPYLEYSNGEVKMAKENVITQNISNIIKEDLIQVVERGTGKECYIEGKQIAGKTGTAEVKKSQDDKDGTEIGWFNSFDETGKLIIAMCENVKDLRGSHYVVDKIRKIYE